MQLNFFLRKTRARKTKKLGFFLCYQNLLSSVRNTRNFLCLWRGPIDELLDCRLGFGSWVYWLFVSQSSASSDGATAIVPAIALSLGRWSVGGLVAGLTRSRHSRLWCRSSLLSRRLLIRVNIYWCRSRAAVDSIVVCDACAVAVVTVCCKVRIK